MAVHQRLYARMGQAVQGHPRGVAGNFLQKICKKVQGRNSGS